MPIKIKSCINNSLVKTYVIAISMLLLIGNLNLLSYNENIASADDIPVLKDRDIVWDVQLDFDEIGGKYDYVVFGEAANATDGPPQDDSDEPKPPAPFPPCIYTWFDDNLDAPYDLLLKDYREYNNMDFKQWNLSVQWMSFDGSTNLNISWDPNDFNDSEYDSVILFYVDENVEVNMITNSHYEFLCPTWVIQEFIINCTIYENLDPVANFTSEPENPSTSDMIYFNSTSYDPDGNITNWYWDFGDSSMDSGEKVTHQYDDNGSYIVNLNVTDENGSTAYIEKIINVSNSPPIANFTYEPTNPLTSDLIYFNSTSYDIGGAIENWTWDFDDGGYGYGGQVTHQYLDDDSYDVELTVIDDDGATGVIIKVINVDNEPPIAVDDMNDTLEDSSVIIDILVNDNDTDGEIDPTTVDIIDDVNNGSTSIDSVSGEVTYTPDSDFYGSDNFTYTVDDDDGDTSNVATVDITIIPVNDAPKANDDTASTTEDTPVPIVVLENDEDDGIIDNATVLIFDDVDNGNTSIDSITGVITYTPDSNYNGPDSFSYTVDDTEDSTSNVATVNITVLPYNDPPVADDDNATTSEDSSIDIDILANDNDTDGEIDPTSVIIVDDVVNGEISVNTSTGEVSYNPDEDYYGSDSFSYTVDDNDGGTSNVAIVNITIISVNDAPIAVDDSASTTKNTQVIIDVLSNDIDDGSLDLSTVFIENNTNHGNTSVDSDSGSVTYTPDSNYNGSDSFSYTVNDTEGATSNNAIVNITVGGENNKPIAIDDTADIDEDKAVWIDVLINDYDTDGDLVNSSVTITSGPDNGSTSINTSTGAIHYTPKADFYGADSFIYTVDDDDGATSNNATVTITVNSIPDAPKFSSPTPTGTGKPIGTSTLSIRIEDPDEDEFDWSITTYPDIGNNSKTNENNGIKTCSISGLTYSRTYTWIVYAVDEHGLNNSQSYSFTTQSAPGGGGGDPGGGGGIPPQPPKPTAVANGPYVGYIDEEIQFNASGSSAYDKIENYTWSFGDGETGYGLNPTHSFNSIETYTIVLTVKDNFGVTDNDETTAVISQPNRAPSNPDVFGPPKGTKNEKYNYSAVAMDQDNDNVQYIFDWDDENSNTTEFLQNGTEVTFSHVWASAGMYTIGVQAYDNQTYSDITKLTVLIDAHIIKDIGYITDDDANGIYDTFHSGELKTTLEQFEGKYLIDTGGNGNWNIVYDIVTEEIAEYKGEITPEEDVDFTVIILLTFSSLIILGMAFYLVNSKKQTRRFKR